MGKRIEDGVAGVLARVQVPSILLREGSGWRRVMG